RRDVAPAAREGRAVGHRLLGDRHETLERPALPDDALNAAKGKGSREWKIGNSFLPTPDCLLPTPGFLAVLRCSLRLLTALSLRTHDESLRLPRRRRAGGGLGDRHRPALAARRR